MLINDDHGGANSCFLVGWFDDESVAREALGHIRASDQPSFIGIHQRNLELDAFYWVLVPPYESRQVAIAASRELSARDIESYVIPSGEQENGISLGLFRSRESAERLLEDRTGQNVAATLVMLPRNRISYALVFEGPSEAIELPEVAHGLAEGGRLQRIEISDCEGVATAEKNP
ncbi:SPOR domain-containing protein [uncultured Marinobacter sp.]|uniref:SPOR domain-containing protein n=1 Tax=uncultured Marinobacter sp. TaxID=187379 RepID=UPI0030DDB014